MFTRLERLLLALVLLCCTALLGQQKAAPSASTAALEFPVTFQESVAAGKTAIGTRVEAKLGMATLVNGTVIPQGAVFSGEVVESTAKDKTEPSKLGIRIDSAQWKSGSVTLKLYLMGWFYPTLLQSSEEMHTTRTLAAPYPADNSQAYPPFPSGASGGDPSGADNSTSSQHRVRMKDVETDRGNDGTITLVSRQSNIKLDKVTTYVLACPDSLAVPVKPAGTK